MKKFFSLIGFGLLFFLFLGNGQDVKAESNLEYDDFFGNHIVEAELTDEQLEFVYKTALSINNSPNYGLISPLNIDGGGNAGTIIDGPYRTKISNKDVRYAISMFGTWIGEKIPPARPYAYGLATLVFQAGEHASDRYVSTWVWKVWDTQGYVPAYKKYTTAVEYTDASYTKIKKLSTYDAGYY